MADLASAGLPCQPFTMERDQVHGPSPEKHKSFDVVFSEFFQYVDTAKPRGFIVEEVKGFSRFAEICGMTWLEKFVSLCTQRG